MCLHRKLMSAQEATGRVRKHTCQQEGSRTNCPGRTHSAICWTEPRLESSVSGHFCELGHATFEYTAHEICVSSLPNAKTLKTPKIIKKSPETYMSHYFAKNKRSLSYLQLSQTPSST